MLPEKEKKSCIFTFIQVGRLEQKSTTFTSNLDFIDKVFRNTTYVHQSNKKLLKNHKKL